MIVTTARFLTVCTHANEENSLTETIPEELSLYYLCRYQWLFCGKHCHGNRNMEFNCSMRLQIGTPRLFNYYVAGLIKASGMIF